MARRIRSDGLVTVSDLKSIGREAMASAYQRALPTRAAGGGRGVFVQGSRALGEQLLSAADVERRAHGAVEVERLLELFLALRAPARFDELLGRSQTKPRLPRRRSALGPHLGRSDEVAIEAGQAQRFPL